MQARGGALEALHALLMQATQVMRGQLLQVWAEALTQKRNYVLCYGELIYHSIYNRNANRCGKGLPCMTTTYIHQRRE